VLETPDNSFGYVPTPALVAPIEFTVTQEEYKTLGGHAESARSVDDIIEHGGEYGGESRRLAPPSKRNVS